jgi:sodium transport system ATP-binding protein
MLKPTGGQVTVNGFDVVEQSYDVRRNIGFVSNNTRGYDRMTAVEMVEFFGRLYGLSEERLQERIEIVFDQLQMNGFRERLGGKMSTGMGQKVSIARAIIHDPPVLVFDEATVGLDVLVARSLIETIGEFQDQGKCIIFSTHHMREVERLCERVAIMYEGAMLAEGNVKELSEIHAQDDLEDLFFDLISNYDRKKESQAISTEEMDA